MTMLLALGVVAVVMLAAALSYNIVGREAEVQGDSRRSKQAFFAAEAGLAEARERVRLLLGDSATYNNVISTLAVAAGEPGLGLQTPEDPWFEVFPDGWQPYTLGEFAVADSEKVDANADPVIGFPDHATVRYRVFLRDDNDDDDQSVDLNRRVWLVSVGEVQVPGGRPSRAVVQALVTNTNDAPIANPGCIGRGCGPAMNFNNSSEATIPTGPGQNI
ncbi:MAG: hypothetical protein WBV82_29070 [Myxococcaceae bacterium]